MFRNYIKIALRNFKRNKVYSLINIFGLSIGLACCMLITMYIYYETTYDSYHKNLNRLYQLGTVFIREGSQEHTGNTPAPIGPMIKADFPEIIESTRIIRTFQDDKTLLSFQDNTGNPKSIYETKGFLADENFFKLLTYNFKEGNPKTALNEPNAIVLSEATAIKLFGRESALNKTLHVSSNTNGDFDFKVTGVFVPNIIPSHIDANFFMSFKGGNIQKYFVEGNTNISNNNMFHTYLLTKEGVDIAQLNKKFEGFIERHAKEDLKSSGFFKKQFLIPVKDIHLHPKVKDNVTPAGSVTYLFILGSIAVLTLLIACINFMNLSTARSSKRSAEVGVRKVLGAHKNSLIKQFLGEAMVMAFFAFVISLLMSLALLPLFSQLSGKELTFSLDQHLRIVVFFFFLSFLTGLIAGSYPAFYLSSFRPVKVLKGKFSNSLAAVSLRKTLVVFQFTISIVLIISSIIIARQMNYLRSKDLGFEKDQQIVIPLRTANSKSIYESLRNGLKNNPRIQSVGSSAYYPGVPNYSDVSMYKEGLTAEQAKKVFLNYVDYDFLQTLKIKPVAGRIFSKEFPADTANRIVLNEKAISQFGFPSKEDAIGKSLSFDWQGENIKFYVIGVVKDFHFKDLHIDIEPYAFLLNSSSDHNFVIAHAKGKDISEVLKSVESTWNSLNPNEPFEYSFLDDDFQKQYQAENRLLSIVGYFTLVAIFISCLGLFGLASFSAEQRIKEIGVRKVLGASMSNIVTLLSKDFLKLVLISIILASPFAWYLMNKWLEDFAFKIGIEWWVFIATGVIAVLIAVFTVSFQAIKAAITNPVKSLRTE